MKKIFFMLSCFAAALNSIAQEPADALRYSWYTSNGTARQQSIGGAMGSLGGEISSIFVNPAGLGFYKTREVVLTPAYTLLNNKATYFGRQEMDKKNGLSFGTNGIVFGDGTNTRKKGMTSNVLALGVNQIANFRSNLIYRGQTSQSSYSQKFLEEIQNNNDKDANHVADGYPYGTSLAFNTYWIDTIAGGTPNNYQFQTRSPIATGLLQENIIASSGGITEIAMAAASGFGDKVFAGITIGIPILTYKREGAFTEADATSNVNNKFDFARVEESLKTTGAGINIRLGMIFKPAEYFRVGLAIHSPTYFSLTDKYSTTITAATEAYKGILHQSSGDITGSPTSDFKYALTTPFRIIASASYVLREIQDVRKQRGFLTADIEFLSYRSSSFHADPSDKDPSTKTYLKSLNQAINNAYKPSFNFRAGGELKFTYVMVRAGVAYYGNPYKNLAGEKGNRFQLTGGLGYRNKGIFIDVAYVHTMGKDIHFPYRLQNGPFTGATIRSTGGNAVLTVGFKI
ncbi:MAG TPA: hypothetical protein VLJ68_08010 [Chitinophagaceae bacterium]|nr:hypothetical protein [Chitinophagaceae bacterium]